MSFTPPTPKRKKIFHYILPIRLVMVQHNCMFCNKDCEEGIYSIYVDRPDYLGYQFCEKCKSEANKCVKKYCKENKIVLLSLLFDDEYASLLDKTFYIPRSNGNIEKWFIECETVSFNQTQQKWCMYFRSVDFKYIKSVPLETVLKLNLDDPDLEKISDCIKTSF